MIAAKIGLTGHLSTLQWSVKGQAIMYGYITINDDTLFCEILDYDISKRVCKVEVNGYIYYDVPFDDVQADEDSCLPWIVN